MIRFLCVGIVNSSHHSARNRALKQLRPKPSTKRSQGCRSFPVIFILLGCKRENFGLRLTSGILSFYVESLPAGIGSNDIGLDRGQLGNSFIVRFDRSGLKVLLVAPNYDFRR